MSPTNLRTPIKVLSLLDVNPIVLIQERKTNLRGDTHSSYFVKQGFKFTRDLGIWIIGHEMPRLRFEFTKYAESRDLPSAT